MSMNISCILVLFVSFESLNRSLIPPAPWLSSAVASLEIATFHFRLRCLQPPAEKYADKSI